MHTCIQFNWNYGSSPAWDHLMGTNYLDGGGAAAKEAQVQAALVGAAVGNATRDGCSHVQNNVEKRK